MQLQETTISTGHANFRHHYLCHYLPMTIGKDTLSRSLMKFKRGAQPDLDAWIDCAREALAEKPPPRGSILLRALGHRELTAQNTCAPQADLHREIHAQNTRPSPLDLLCHSLAGDFRCHYLPALLSKSHTTAGNKNLSRPEREAELLEVYSADPGGLPASTPLLLIDDILTTGATLRAIITALRRGSPACPIRVFTLARAASAPNPRDIRPLHSRNYYFDPETGWSRITTPTQS